MRCLLHDEPCSLQLCHETGECSFPTVCYPSASQPDPTPQDVAAPTLEQLAKDAESLAWHMREFYEACKTHGSPSAISELAKDIGPAEWTTATPPCKSRPET